MPVAVSARAARRPGRQRKRLVKAGFTRVHALDGGIKAWIEAQCRWQGSAAHKHSWGQSRLARHRAGPRVRCAAAAWDNPALSPNDFPEQ